MPQPQKYKYAVIATDVAIFSVHDDQLEVLLMKMKKAPYEKAWAIPGGLVEPKESVEQAARRHLHLKAGAKNIFLEQLYTFGEVDRDPFGRVVSVAYYALVAPTGLTLDKTDYEVRWWPISHLPAMAYDHKDIVTKAVERIRAKLGYTNVVYSLLPATFTLSELQATYEAILDTKLDKRNFRKKILALKLVEPTGKSVEGQAHRPAAYYRFVRKQPTTVSILAPS